MKSPCTNTKLNHWVQECATLCQPDNVYWCDGSTAEYDRLMAQLVASGMAIPLKTRPNSFLFRSDPSDVARVEDRTYISTPSKIEAGPTNNWIDPSELKGDEEILQGPFISGGIHGGAATAQPRHLGLV